MEVDDLDLLDRARHGDLNAFNELMRRHEDTVYAICYRMLGDRADALDATQDTFVNVFRRAKNFRGDSAFSTWLYRVAINAGKDLLRRKARAPIPHEELPEQAATGQGFEDQMGLREDLKQALAQLPDDYREAVVMHDIGGIPYEEIAAATGSALGTVKSRISRGRRQLAKLLEQPTGADASKEQT